MSTIPSSWCTNNTGTVLSSVLTGAYNGSLTATNYGNLIAGDSFSDTSMQVNGTLVVQGRDVLKELDELRDSVLLLKRHVDMEAKYPKLKELKDAYESQHAKYKTFDAIKESK